MKTVPLKKVAVKKLDGTEGTLDYKSQLLMIFRAPLRREDGLDIDELRYSIRLIEALEKATGEFCEFEDADYAHLVEKVKASKFTFAAPEFLRFVEDVTGA